MLPSESPSKHVLLLSNSIQYGSGYLDHAEAEIHDFLGHVKRVLFVPYAMYDHEAYTNKTRNRLSAMGYELDSVHTTTEPRRAIEQADALFIGGGNTFRLL